MRLLPFLMVVMFTGPAAVAQPEIPRPKPVAKPGVTLTNDVVYETVDDQKLMLDIAVPSAEGPFPLVICLHGGAWKAGSRKDLSRGVLWADFGNGRGGLIESLAAEGYVAASVSYRLAPQSKFPAQIQDVKTAVRFLKANAKKYKLDPNRIGVVGFSAGGHLAALMGTATAEPKFETSLYSKQSSKINCVVDFFGPADLTLYTETPGIEKSFMVPLLGATSDEHMEIYQDASPVTYASKNSVPFLILHGTTDLIVPILHSKRLHAKLIQAGVESELVPVPFKGHGWFGDEARDSYARTLKFLDKHLKS